MSVATTEAPRIVLPRMNARRPRYHVEPRRIRPIWRRAPRSMLRRILDPAMFWMTFGSYEGDPIVFDPWQVAHLRDYSRLRAREKAPQIGFSWLCALEALHECMVFDDVTSGFVSVDQREATEKVLYARKAYYELPRRVRQWVPLAKDSTDELHFGDTARPSRIMSIPATAALRGRRMSVYLDEVDFYRDGGEAALRVALGRITRGGRVTMGSTCFGVDTQLDKVMQGEERNFSRAVFPWQVAVNPDVIATVQMAREEMTDEAFEEEYECVRGGSTGDSFPASLIRQQQHEDPLVEPEHWEPVGPAVGGYDVGKNRAPSVLCILEHTGARWEQRVLHEPRDEKGGHMTLPEQQRLLQNLLRRVKRLSLAVDAQGVGAQTAQALTAEFGDRVVEVVPGSKPSGLPSQHKAELATELKRALESDEVALAADRQQSQQFRRTRINGHLVDQPGSRKKSHYDRFWSTAYAWYGTLAGQALTSVYDRQDLRVIRAGRRLPWE